MTVREYVDNPMGRGDAALGTNRTMLQSILTDKYERLVSKNKIKAKYLVRRGGREYLIHLVIPSESERGNTYDVVFEFSDPKGVLVEEPSLRNYDVRVFANSPSFAYTFAYVYKKNNLLIDSLVNKLGKKFVKIAPDVRNRYQVVNYEKYVFFGAKYLIESGLLIKKTLEKDAKPIGLSGIASQIRTLEEIMKEYDAAEAKVKAKKKKEKVAEQRRDAQKKKELQQVKSGIHTISPGKKTMGHAVSTIKPKKAVRSTSNKRK